MQTENKQIHRTKRTNESVLKDRKNGKKGRSIPRKDLSLQFTNLYRYHFIEKVPTESLSAVFQLW